MEFEKLQTASLKELFISSVDFVRRAAHRRAAAHGAGVGGDDGCKPGCGE